MQKGVVLGVGRSEFTKGSEATQERGWEGCESAWCRGHKETGVMGEVSGDVLPPGPVATGAVRREAGWPRGEVALAPGACT